MLTPSKPSKVLSDLQRSSQLSNAVSKQALADAIDIYTDYLSTGNQKRDVELLLEVTNKLQLIINQVMGRRCRINPCSWLALCRLNAKLSRAYALKQIVEPNTHVEAVA